MLKWIVAGVAALAAGPAVAQISPWTVDATVGAVSDYRYRGYSLSDENPALQAGVTATHESGFYADVYVSSIAAYGVGEDGDGAEVEITGSLGWTRDLAGYGIAVSVAAYRYPDGDDVDYIELPVQVSRSAGALTGSVGLAYAPAQRALGDEENTYGWTALEYAPAAWPVGLTGRLGYETGAFAPDGKTDWEIGVNRDLGPATLGLTWVDSDATRGVAAASVFFNF